MIHKRQWLDKDQTPLTNPKANIYLNTDFIVYLVGFFMYNFLRVVKN